MGSVEYATITLILIFILTVIFVIVVLCAFSWDRVPVQGSQYTTTTKKYSWTKPSKKPKPSYTTVRYPHNTPRPSKNRTTTRRYPQWNKTTTVRPWKNKTMINIDNKVII